MAGMTREQAKALAELVNLLRPTWTRQAIYEALKPAAADDPITTTLRAVYAARDPFARPSDIPTVPLGTRFPPERQPPTQPTTTHARHYAPATTVAADPEVLGDVPPGYRYGTGYRPEHVEQPKKNDRPAVDMPFTPGTVTEPQLRMLHIMFHIIGLTNRDEYLGYCQSVVDREITTTKDLSRDEASRVITRARAIEAETEFNEGRT